MIEAVIEKILNSSELELKTMRKERFDDILKVTDHLMGRLYHGWAKKLKLNEISLKIVKKFLSLDFLERRIDGAKLL